MADIERTRAVVEADERYDGRIFPAERAELNRPVRVRSGATVEGDIYGDTVEIDDDVAVEGSVMAAEAVELAGGRVEGELGTPGKVVATGSHVEGTVTGKRVRLTDCVVRGNVVGSDVILENCVVLGIATSDRNLTVENSLCYTFRSHGDTTLENATVVLPQALADGPLTFETPVRVAGLGQLDVADDGDALPTMAAEDVYDQDGTTYLTLAPRVLNLEAVTDRLDELERAVMAAVDDTSGDGTAEMSVADVLELLDVDVDRPAGVDGTEE